MKELSCSPILHSKEVLYPEDGVFKVFDDANFTIVAKQIKHSCFTVGYVIMEKTSRKLDLDKLNDIGIPRGPLYNDLKIGKSIEFKGIKIESKDVTIDAPIGRKVVILGDTFDPSNISDFAMDCDLLVHEATNRNENLSEALKHGHSTASFNSFEFIEMTAEFANKIRAKSLIITHFSPRTFLEDTNDDVQVILNQVKEVFKGPVYAAKVKKL